jgi:hypothetical protein
MFNGRWLVVTVLISVTWLGSSIHCTVQERYPTSMVSETTPNGPGNGGGGVGGGTGPSA